MFFNAGDCVAAAITVSQVLDDQPVANLCSTQDNTVTGLLVLVAQRMDANKDCFAKLLRPHTFLI